MGSGIACHFANIGVEVLLLDIIPRELNDKEKAKGLTLEDKVVRNRLVNDSLKASLHLVAFKLLLYNHNSSLSPILNFMINYLL